MLFGTYVVPTVAVAIIWDSIYSTANGPLNTVLAATGLPSPAWLASPRLALLSLIVLNVWQMLGYYVVLVTAGLTQLPGNVIESALIDGAGPVRMIWNITVPLMRNTLVFVGLISVVNSVQVFDAVYLLTSGGPLGSTNVISYNIQQTAFQNGLAGQASAMAFVLVVAMIMLFSLVGVGARLRHLRGRA
jgi:ABC-type sugar transport system permease subunit